MMVILLIVAIVPPLCRCDFIANLQENSASAQVPEESGPAVGLPFIAR
jgi:hypothetical protein